MDQDMQVQAARLLPLAVPEWESTLTKPTQLYVCVRKHDLPFTAGETDDSENYLWFKGHGNLSIARIIAVYRERHQDVDIALRPASTTASLSDDCKISDLPHRDRLLVLTAMTHVKGFTPLHSSFSGPAASQGSPRPPLQPINRQLQAQPMQSPSASETSKIISRTPSTTARRPSFPNLRPIKAEMSPSGVAQAPPALSSGTASQYMTPGRTQQQPSPAMPSVPGLKHEPVDEPDQNDDAEETQPYVPKDQGDPFAASQEDEATDVVKGIPLRELTEETIPERLEAGVAVGLQLLSEIEKPLKDLSNEDAKNWLQQIVNVRQDAIKSKTIVGVVGNTGAGKSSVINAMLDEERLVPTNCMRACTAVVTEMNYNESSNPHNRYRAEIDFIKPEEWEKELHVLSKEMLDESGYISREVSNPDSEAGIAYAKIRAVYNKHTREMLMESSPEKLMRVKHIQKVLGTTRKFCDSDASSFYRKLQQYVDSKEKGTEKKDKNGKKIGERKRPFEFWPLIKVVRIFTKADALSTGAIIVDLPGVHDSNAARAAVAAGYMKQCTGLWIVAPINRAVDDKAAKTLLGDTFKRQLKFDGTYSAVTFICSKTDDISRTEAQDSLDLGDQMQDLDNKTSDVESRRRDALGQLKDAKSSKQDYEATVEDVEEQIEAWEALEEEADAGKVVYAPSTKKRKRVAEKSEKSASKRRRRTINLDDSDDDYRDDDKSDSEMEESFDDEVQGESLSTDDISRKLDEMKEVKKNARRERRALDDRIKELRDALAKLDEESEAIDAVKSAICIKGRNEYSRGAIQQDFAAGIRELDQENAAEEDPDNFDPSDDIRDYEEVARTLPVFCVSSRAYQKLSGRLQKDNDVPGFIDMEQTEIPQLQKHCKKLTVKGRQASCRRFLNNLKQLLTSLDLWASDDGSGTKLTHQQRDIEKSFLARKLKELEKALEKVVTDTLQDAVETLDEQLFTKFQPAMQAAVGDAIPTSTGWGARRDEGGLMWSTYKATVRRSGVFAGAAGHRDFNGELAEPIYKHLASAWEKAFQRRLPNIIGHFQKSAYDVLKRFHAAVEQRTRERGLGLSRVMLLGTQLDGYKAIFGDLVTTAVTQLNEGQRELNREFTPAIGEKMEQIYEWCAAESGAGQFKRMKSAVHDHVSRNQASMFQAASDQVKGGLLDLCKSIKSNMLDSADKIFVDIKRDYGGVVGLHSTEGMKMSREERSIRRAVDEVIEASDKQFQGVLSIALDELKAQQAQEEVEPGKPEEVANMDIDDDLRDSETEEEGAGNESDGSDGEGPEVGSASVMERAQLEEEED